MIARSLAGRTVVVASSEDNAPVLADAIREAGGRAISLPTVRLVPPQDSGALDDALHQWATYDWIVFTSRHGVEAVVARARALGLDLTRPGGRIAAVGPATKAAAETEGWTVTAMPAEYRTDAIVEALGDVRGKTVLLPRSRIARRALAEDLRRRGARTVEVDAYDAARVPLDVEALRSLDGVDFIVFTSGSTVDSLAEGIPTGLLEELRRRSHAACIGPVTAEAARRWGFRVTVVAPEHTIPGLLRALEEEALHE